MDAPAPLHALQWSRTQLALVAGVVLLVSAAVLIGLARQGTGSAPAERSRYDNGLGYATTAASAFPLNSPQPRRSLRAVPLIAGAGPCLAAMDAMREVMHAVPSGGLLPKAPGWAKLVSPRMAAVNRACGESTAQAFRNQELLPWDNAVIPAGAKIPPAPPA